jgi:AcrR family transcriptional regulator
MSPSPTKPARRSFQRASVDSRREDLIQAALKLIADGGAQAATVRAIAAEAGVTAGLIRHYFSSKEDLVRAAYQHLMGGFTATSANVANDAEASPETRLAHFVIASITPPVAEPASVGQWAGFLHLMRHDVAMRELHQQHYFLYRDMLQDLIAALPLRPNMPARSEAQLRRAAIACNGVIDGLWLEASLISDSFTDGEILSIGLDAVGAILGIDLAAAYTPK